MKRLLVDTNVLVSFLTDREPKQQEIADALFRGAANGDFRLLIPQIALCEMVYVLRNLYGVVEEEIADLFADLFALPGVATLDDLPWSRLLKIWPSEIREFGDACLAALVLEGSGEAVVTFDQKFQRRLQARGLSYAWDAP